MMWRAHVVPESCVLN